MSTSTNYDYQRIASAIGYIAANVSRQPSLEEIAAYVHLSPFHFQRMFTEWAGVSPKKFLQFLTVGYAKKLLTRSGQQSLFDAAHNTGLSGTGRLHDLFITVEGMTPGEYRDGGKGLLINTRVNNSRFGNYVVASTQKGICDLHFFDDDPAPVLDSIKQQWHKATFSNGTDVYHEKVSSFFNDQLTKGEKINLHLYGTGFQLKVWQALLEIPEGQLTSYGAIAQKIGQRSASRAVGSAIASNHVAYLIPCHRVIRNAGVIGDFRWGTPRKTAMIGWEAAHTVAESSSVY